MTGLEAASVKVQVQRRLRRKPRLAPACDRPFCHASADFQRRLVCRAAGGPRFLGRAYISEVPVLAYENVHLSDILQHSSSYIGLRGASNCSECTGASQRPVHALQCSLVHLSRICRLVQVDLPRPGHRGNSVSWLWVLESPILSSRGWTHPAQRLYDLLAPAQLVIYQATTHTCSDLVCLSITTHATL